VEEKVTFCLTKDSTFFPLTNPALVLQCDVAEAATSVLFKTTFEFFVTVV
jgi:hypothetical protein